MVDLILSYLFSTPPPNQIKFKVELYELRLNLCGRTLPFVYLRYILHERLKFAIKLCTVHVNINDQSVVVIKQDLDVMNVNMTWIMFLF